MTNVSRFYNSVIEDVINSVRESSNEDRIDEAVLEELKRTWQQKLAESRAIDNERVDGGGTSVGAMINDRRSMPANSYTAILQQQQQQRNLQQQQQRQVLVTAQQHASTTAQNAMRIIHPSTVPVGTAIQLAPAGASMTGGATAAAMALPQGAVYQAQLPAGMTLQSMQSGQGQYLQVNGQTMFVTTARPQTLVNAPQHQQQQQHHLEVKPQLDGLDDSDSDDSDDSDDGAGAAPRGPASFKTHGAAAKHSKTNISDLVVRPKQEIRDEVDDDDLDEDDLDDVDEDEEVSGVGAGASAEDDTKEGQEVGPPLNSDDDVSDEETETIFDTDNVVVCQYDKISRTRNKWKFNFKDGIMNLNGKDYVFQKANGDAEW